MYKDSSDFAETVLVWASNDFCRLYICRLFIHMKMTVEEGFSGNEGELALKTS